MNNIRKRIIALAALVCVAFSSVAGCSDNDSKDSNNATVQNEGEDIIDSIKNEDGVAVITPFQTGRPGENGFYDSNADLSGDDPTVTTSAADYDASIVTEIVTVTGTNGEPVTNAAGQPVTEIVTKTKTTTTTTSGSGVSAADYVSATDSMYCLWIDISDDVDYVFNDEFIKITFKIKDNIPDRDYPVRISPDFSTVAGITKTPDKISQGTIRVGGSIEAQDVSSESGFVAYGDNVSCKQGDTIDYYLNLKNNPGLAAILVWFYYDSNAMEVIEVTPVGEFADIAVSTQVGTNPDNAE